MFLMRDCGYDQNLFITWFVEPAAMHEPKNPFAYMDMEIGKAERVKSTIDRQSMELSSASM
jgi:hypothetical protein